MRLIDADRLLTDRMKSKYYHLPNGDVAIPLIDIEHAPTIEPERKKGVWLPIIDANELGEPYQSGVYCSECGETELYEYCFCRTCGADMRKEGDTE